MIKDLLEVIFNPPKEEREEKVETIIKGALELGKKSNKLYLDNCIFTLIIDSIEKKAPVFLVKKKLRCPPISFKFKTM